MKKKLNNKGFAFAELLTVAVVVLGIFMVVYSNLFPIMGELEVRQKYNDISSTYAAYYVRKQILDKMYEDEKKINDYYTNISESYENKNNDYKLIYSNNSNIALKENFNISEIASKLDIKKVYLSTYNISALKKDLADENPYIDYLPNFKNYGNNKLNNIPTEFYRIIVETNTGYATMPLYSTQILTCPPIDRSEFTDENFKKLIVDKYQEITGKTKTFNDLNICDLDKIEELKYNPTETTDMIDDISGIEQLKKLTSLNLSNNIFSNNTITLQENDSITNLELNNCNLSTINNLENFSNLEILKIKNNNFNSELDLSNNKDLTIYLNDDDELLNLKIKKSQEITINTNNQQTLISNYNTIVEIIDSNKLTGITSGNAIVTNDNLSDSITINITVID